MNPVLLFGKIQISQYSYYLRDLIHKNNQNKLFSDGVMIYEKFFNHSFLNELNHYTVFDDYNFSSARKIISEKDTLKILQKIDKVIKDTIKPYLGNNLYCTESHMLTLGNKTSTEGSYQPHHDYKGRRVKIFIWVNDSKEKTHPLYYLQGSQKKFKIWETYDQTRFRNTHEDQMYKFSGNRGDMALFDTHGIHSNFKKTTGVRSVIKLVFENFGFNFRLNDRSLKGKEYLKKCKAIKID